MKHFRIRFSLFMVSVCLISIILGFAGGVDIASFKKNYVESLVASYGVAGAEPVRKIEYAVKYGKPLSNFYGMNSLLSETKRDFPEIDDIKIIMPNGKVAYNIKKAEKGLVVSDSIKNSAFSEGVSENTKNYLSVENKYHILLPIQNEGGAQIGALDIVLENAIINEKITNYFNNVVAILTIIALFTILLIFLIFFFMPIVKADGEIRIKTVTIVLILILSVGQFVFGVINYNLYKKIYIETSKENTSMVVKVVQRDMNFVIQKGISVKELNGVEGWLNSIVKSVPEIESLYITNMRGEVFYKTKSLILMQEEIIDPMYNYSLPLVQDDFSQKGLVNLVLSKKYIEKKLVDIALDTVTVLVISFIFMTEIMITWMLFLARRKERLERTTELGVEMEGPKIREDAAIAPVDELTKLKMIRPVAFVFFFAFSMTTSFIPVVMRGFKASLPWVSESLRLGLPVSFEVLGTIISTILTGYIIKKKGWKPPFFYGIVLVCIGSILSGASFSGVMFILARLVTGVGYGFAWMSMRGYVGSFPSENEQTQGFSSLNSGIMSGLNCGIVLGAMIADRAGYSVVFYATVVFMIVSAFVAFIMIKNNGVEVELQETGMVSMKADVLHLLSDKQVLRFILLILIPASICGAFLSYLFPVSASAMGISSANIGRAFLVYGLFVVYLGPFFGKHLGSKFSVKKSIVVANFVYAAAILVFAFMMNINTAYVAVLLLGLADSFGLAAQSSCFLGFDASKKVGSGVSIATFSVFYKVGQMIGPVIFGILIAFGMGFGVKVIGLCTVALLILYMALNREKIVKNEDQEKIIA